METVCLHQHPFRMELSFGLGTQHRRGEPHEGLQVNAVMGEGARLGCPANQYPRWMPDGHGLLWWRPYR